MSLFIISCSIDGDVLGEPPTKADPPSPAAPSLVPAKEVLKSFDIKFPNATDVTWSVNDSYYVADFAELSSTVNAWFEPEGAWLLSKTSLTSAQLNKEVEKTFQNSLYASYQLIGRSRLDRRDLGCVYLIETSQGAQHTTIYYTENGDFIKTVKSAGAYTDKPLEIPEQVAALVASRFAGAQILDVWEDSLSPKAGVMENNTYKVATFTSAYEWVSTLWVVEEPAVPAVVMNSFKTSTHGASQIECIRIMEHSEDLSYLFYFFEGGKNKIATLLKSGHFVSIISY
ncbi:MAG: PepSY-like domain-containing protein [Tannerellaceae bacterium]|nr:PepSY-like domain-containing protein [Tannerellaceae bacterium]